MKFQPLKHVPVLIVSGVVIMVCLIRVVQPEFFERLERMTYDMRVRESLKFEPTTTTNLGFVYINDSSLDFVRNNTSLGYNFGLYWPRQVYGRLVEELAAQGAKAVAFDVIFGEKRPDHPPVQMANGRLIESDDFFALQMRRASNVIIAATKDIVPPPLFTTNAMALGDITTDKDSDGILRRAKAFRIYRKWHWAFRQVAADPDWGVDLQHAKVEPRQIILPRTGAPPIKIPLDDQGNFDLTDFGGDKLPPGVPRKAKPFTDERFWHMGIVLAARELGLDLSKAEVDLPDGRIVLRGADGVERIIPVDKDGYFYIDWCLTPSDPRLSKDAIQNLFVEDKLRLLGTNDLPDSWAGKLVVVGSSATGNDLTDRGATPLDRDTLLVSEHWNVANSILTNRFVRRSSLAIDLLLITAMGVLAALLTWRLRALLASLLVVLSAVAYIVFGAFLYVDTRYWLPLVFPVFGALLMTHVCLVTWRVVFEQAEKRRVKSVFSKIVSPEIVNELLKAETFTLGGVRREITVLFADVRGFTALTDESHEKATEFVRERKLDNAAAEAYFDEQARETLNTVNAYLALVADTVKKHDGTLDKYIGDCVMAFWGAPTPNPKHALACVRAAIDAQRAVRELNLQRSVENRKRELENLARVSAGLAPRPLQPILLLGTGINTGLATVGLMGSEAHISNYTVFGREVNLASRLESLSGRGRIIISEPTYSHLLRDDPTLAATCAVLPPVNVKGIRTAIKVYEAPWRPADAPPFDEEFSASATADAAALTGFIQRSGA